MELKIVLIRTLSISLSQNHTADCLSHLPLPAPAADPSADIEPEIVALISSTLHFISVSDFETA